MAKLVIGSGASRDLIGCGFNNANAYNLRSSPAHAPWSWRPDITKPCPPVARSGPRPPQLHAWSFSPRPVHKHGPVSYRLAASPPPSPSLIPWRDGDAAEPLGRTMPEQPVRGTLSCIHGGACIAHKLALLASPCLMSKLAAPYHLSMVAGSHEGTQHSLAEFLHWPRC